MFCTRAGTVRSATANGGGQYAVCDAEAREDSAALRMEPARGDLPEAVLCLRTACKPASAVTIPRIVPKQCLSLRFSAPWARFPLALQLHTSSADVIGSRHGSSEVPGGEASVSIDRSMVCGVCVRVRACVDTHLYVCV